MIDLFALLTAACGLIGCTTLFNCVEGKGSPATQTREVGPFKGITIEGSMEVVVRQGTEQNVRIVAQENLLPLLTTTIAGDRLVIGSKECYVTQHGVKVFITAPDLNGFRIDGSGSFTSDGTIRSESLALRIDGSGDMTLDLDVSALTTRIDGSGDVVLRGKAVGNVVQINGSGDVEADSLATERCTIEINGSGDCDVNVATSLDVEINGVGDVTFAGNVENVRKEINGIGEVSRVR